MKIDLKNPIISSVFSIGITFVIFILIFYVTNPSYIMEISKNGKKKKNIYLLLTYSLLFGILVGICVFLYKTGSKSSSVANITFSTYNGRSFRPKLYSPI